MMRSCVIVILMLICKTLADAEEILVETNYGPIKGKVALNVIDQKPFYQFLRIPYAKPPVGELRFQVAQPIDPWTEVLDGTNDLTSCPSFSIATYSIVGSEDCLYLNVNTPQSPEDLKNAPVPVMVWIHGGAFYAGSGETKIYGPDFIVHEDVIFVSINYRLGVFGFLSLGNEEVPGNNGLKDQIVALTMIKSIIPSFGGDPNRITIFGESAGGASVHHLLLSPLSEGLFQRAIAQSGVTTCPWSISDENLAGAKALGEVNECNIEDMGELLACLRNIATNELAMSQYYIMSDKEYFLLPLPFLPCIEPENEFQFLSDHPLNLLKEGNFMDVPFMTGTTDRESLSLTKALKMNLNNFGMKYHFPTLEEFNANPALLVPDNIGLNYGSDEWTQIGTEMKTHYFTDQDISEETVPTLVDLVSDTMFVLGAHRATHFHIKHKQSPVYNYVFSFDGQYTFSKKLLETDLPGVPHADELGYLFFNSGIQQTLEEELPEFQVMKKLVKLWTNFAKYGNPTPTPSELGIEWEPATEDRMVYLDIGSDLTIKETFHKENMEFWDSHISD